MRCTILALVLSLCSSMAAQQASVPKIPFESVPDFLKLPRTSIWERSPASP